MSRPKAKEFTDERDNNRNFTGGNSGCCSDQDSHIDAVGSKLPLAVGISLSAMARDKKTVDKQLRVLGEFFRGDLAQSAILTKYRVTEQAWRAWQFDTDFTDEFDRRIASAHRESAALLARYAPTAAGLLIALAKSPKEEIARRACLDIIALPRPPVPGPAKAAAAAAPPSSEFQLSEKAASAMLQALADASDYAP